MVQSANQSVSSELDGSTIFLFFILIFTVLKRRRFDDFNEYTPTVP